MPRKAKLLKRENPIIAVIDTETDPFEHGATIRPFICGYYEWGLYREFIGADCMVQMIDFIGTLKSPRTIYAHNGGKFDYFFMLEHLDNPIKIINGRIAKAKCGVHEFRDSYSIIPVALSAYQKTIFDYSKMHVSKRDQHMHEISEYLKDDCHDLYDLVSSFNDRFGPKLTIGSCAIGELRKYHSFDFGNKRHDVFFRPYYYGGRVQCFEGGIITGNWKVFDVNSMYPAVMKNAIHPTGKNYVTRYEPKINARGTIEGTASNSFYFAAIECTNDNALPIRTKSGLSFDCQHGTFKTTSHEIIAALECGKISNVRVIESHHPCNTIRFSEFVDAFVTEKISAKNSKDKIAEIFAKLVLNSAYGKFGTNPDNYVDWHIQPPGEPSPGPEYDLYMVHDSGVRIWTTPTSRQVYFDVATAASITSAARAVLMRALHVSERPVYCDTDSIICENLPLEHSETVLGAWKLEATGQRIAIAGKKLYALETQNGKFKKACKGAVMSGQEIFKVARGLEHHWKSETPTFSIANGVSYVDRKIQSPILQKAFYN